MLITNDNAHSFNAIQVPFYIYFFNIKNKNSIWVLKYILTLYLYLNLCARIRITYKLYILNLY